MKTCLQKVSLLSLCTALSGALLASPPGNHPRDNWHKWAGFAATGQTTTLQSLWVEDFSLSNGTTADSGSSAWTSAVTYAPAVFGVYNNEFEVNNISVNGLGTWTSAPISIAGKTNVQLSAGVRSAGSLENDGSAHTDYIRFYYKVDGGAEVLFSNLGGIINNNSTTNSTVSTTGSTISGSTVQIIIRAKATATDEFYYFDNVTVAGTDACTADASTATSGMLTCATTSVQLLGSSTVSGAVYNWSGPNGFSSAVQSPFVSVAGTYNLLVTAPGGCTASSGIAVAQSTTPPAGLSAFVNQPLTCNVTSVSLTGSSTTAGVSYAWAGPSGYTANTALAHTSAPGLYILTVTNPLNGCNNTVQLTVSQNITPPANVTATNSGPLTCDVIEVTLTGSSSSPNVEYEWVGPGGYLSFSAQDVADVAGNYVLTVTNDNNGCVLFDTTVVVYNCSGQLRVATAAAAANSTGSSFEWKAYPNPYSAKAFIEFKSPTADFVTVQVYSNSGLNEKNLFSNRVAANQTYTLSLESLPAGLHYILIRVNNKIYTQKIISVK